MRVRDVVRGVVGYTGGAAPLPDGPQSPGVEIHPAALRLGRERRSGAGKQRAFVSRGAESFHQPQYLPLPAAHFSSAIEMEDSHQT